MTHGTHGDTSVERPGERPVEARLRRALDARAASVTVRDLRPAEPPGLRPHHRPAGAVLRWRRFALPAAALAAAAAAAVAGYALLAPDPGLPRP
ncbi:hypothetical protein AB0F11_37690, partial [Streptomyces sp. NPDC032472]